MHIRIIGAIFILLGCTGFGFLAASNHRRETNTLRQFINILEFMQNELQYRLTPLPELCMLASNTSKGILKQVFQCLSHELENQILPDAQMCMHSVIEGNDDIPKLTKYGLSLLGRSIGRFDINGQLNCLKSIQMEMQQTLNEFSKNQADRLRSYQTLGICAGAAALILLL